LYDIFYFLQYSQMKSILNKEEILYAKHVMSQKLHVPANDPSASSCAEHVEHCMHQLIRFSHLATKGHAFRALQFGLNLGRAQELLDSVGGVDKWWRLYEPLLVAQDYEKIIKVTKQYLKDLGLKNPTATFINKV
jgi:hypothetical protein